MSILTVIWSTLYFFFFFVITVFSLAIFCICLMELPLKVEAAQITFDDSFFPLILFFSPSFFLSWSQEKHLLKLKFILLLFCSPTNCKVCFYVILIKLNCQIDSDHVWKPFFSIPSITFNLPSLFLKPWKNGRHLSFDAWNSQQLAHTNTKTKPDKSKAIEE